MEFSRALLGHARLDPKTTELVTGPRAETGQGPDARYGDGFMVHTAHGQRAFGHYGGFTVVLSNYGMGSQRVIARLQDWVARP